MLVPQIIKNIITIIIWSNTTIRHIFRRIKLDNGSNIYIFTFILLYSQVTN